MSETVLTLPPAGHTFALPDGTKFELDLVEALRRMNEIASECRAAGSANFEHVEKFRTWVAETVGKPIALSLSQTETLMRVCTIEYHRQKKDTEDALRSLTFTEPPPSSSQPEFDLDFTPTSKA